MARGSGAAGGHAILIGFDMPVIGVRRLPPARSTRKSPRHPRARRGGLLAAADLPGLVDPVAETVAALRRKGFGRCSWTARRCRSRTSIPPTLKDRPTLQVIVDRLKIEGDLRTRLTDSIETAYVEGGGAAFASSLPRRAAGGRADRAPFSERFECRECNIPYEVPQPRLFSFNNPFGACPTCHGFGNIIELDMALVVPDPSKSISRARSSPGASRTTARSSPS